MPEPLPNKYIPADHEPTISAKWDAANAFHADPSRVVNGEAKPYCILIPPPNVTAALHLGHALNNTLQDILTRAHRMKGYETLWMPGTDHAGIATQTVVDKRLKAEGQPALADYKKLEAEGQPGREQFIEKVQAWKDEYEATITDQLKLMGCSCDWQRQRFTMDPVCARAVREAFFRLFRDGLIYRGKRLVNWDPVTQTALADDEVESHDVDSFFWYMKYPIVDEQGNETGEHATVATTRPETYFGDTAVAINPNDPERKHLIGKRAKLPFVGRVIPIIGDDYVVMPDADSSDTKAQFASGFLKVTPAHDPNDYDIGLRHDLPQINVMAPDASISADHGWEDVGEAAWALGLSREDARKQVEDRFRDADLLADKKTYTHAVGHSYRSHAIVEPYLSDQWYVRVTDDRLKGAALRAMATDQRTEVSLTNQNEDGAAGVSTRASSEHDGTLRFHPDRYAKTFETWHDNLRDWCISRQLWWGHRIPVWHKHVEAQAGRDEWLDAVHTSDVDLMTLDEDGHYSVQIVRSDTGEVVDTSGYTDIDGIDALKGTALDIYVCRRDAEWNQRFIDMLEDLGFTQDPDVLDTWFSSALWPLSTLGWPDAKAAAADTGLADFGSMLEAFNPTSVLTTAREIITLWVSRMVMFNRYLLGDSTDGQLPFNDVFIHAMIQDGEGRKMSKSLGNGVDPRDIIHSHGADAMRFTLCEMTTQTQDVRMPVELDENTGKNTSPKFDKGRNFCTKLFNATKFVCMMLDEHKGNEPETAKLDDLEPIDRWMLARLARATTRINEALNNYEFSVVGNTLYELLWKDFCDWYLEGVKPTIKTNPAQRVVLQQTLEAIVRLLHPVAPFITEVLYEQLRARRLGTVEGLNLPTCSNDELCCTTGWPIADASLDNDFYVEAFGRTQRFIEAIRQVRAQHQVPPRRQITLHTDAETAAKIAGLTQVTLALAGVETIEVTKPPADANPVAFTIDGVEHHLTNLADALDAGAETERLTKLVDDLTKSLAALDKRLSNPGYTDKAPKHLVDETRAQRDQKAADLDAAKNQLETLT
ncbi:MAG: valine--tRNA ligase [Planctomycetota bacterium]